MITSAGLDLHMHGADPPPPHWGDAKAVHVRAPRHALGHGEGKERRKEKATSPFQPGSVRTTAWGPQQTRVCDVVVCGVLGMDELAGAEHPTAIFHRTQRVGSSDERTDGRTSPGACVLARLADGRAFVVSRRRKGGREGALQARAVPYRAPVIRCDGRSLLPRQPVGLGRASFASAHRGGGADVRGCNRSSRLQRTDAGQSAVEKRRMQSKVCTHMCMYPCTFRTHRQTTTSPEMRGRRGCADRRGT